MANNEPLPEPSRLFWRPMMPDDMEGVFYIGGAAHEDEATLTERASLFPDGCLVLADRYSDLYSDTDEPRMIYGYAISHPILYNSPPALNSILGSVPANPVTADQDDGKGQDDGKDQLNQPQYYIHHVFVTWEMRGHGLAGVCILHLLNVAREHGYKTTVLISLYGTSDFWLRYGFEPLGDLDEALKEMMKGYANDAAFMVRKEF